MSLLGAVYKMENYSAWNKRVSRRTDGGWPAVESLMCSAHAVARWLVDGVNDTIRDVSERTETDHLSYKRCHARLGEIWMDSGTAACFLWATLTPVDGYGLYTELRFHILGNTHVPHT